MSFIVTDLPMPKDCWHCPCWREVFIDSENKIDNMTTVEIVTVCAVTGSQINDDQIGRLKDCKLFEIRPFE